MTYLALLRGINVGGKNMVDMKALKATFGRAGMESVQTYINSGNVIFSHSSLEAGPLSRVLERAIEADFGIPARVLVRGGAAVIAMAQALPAHWENGESAKCDVMFLWDELDGPEVLERLTIKPGIDEVMYVPGAILWRVERANATRSGMLRIASSDLYGQMTVRNCNTVRKLADLIGRADA